MFHSPASSFDARVAQGVAFLNDHINPNWWQKVSLLTLDVGKHCSCPFAQATGVDYDLAVTRCHITIDQEIDYGFFHSLFGDDVTQEDILRHYTQLTKAWSRAIIALEAGTYIGAITAKEALPA